MHIENSLTTKFCLKNDSFEFLDQINTKKGICELKKWNYYQILHIQINLDSKFQFQTFWFLEQIPKKSILPVEIREKWTSPLNPSYSNYSKYQISA